MPTGLKNEIGLLGKKEYVPDERTIFIGEYVRPEVHVPSKFDFDRHRRPLPNLKWGTNKWNCIVIAAQANQLLRLERVGINQTILLADSDVIRRYQALTGSVAPRDVRDEGMAVLDAMKNWRNNGWPLETKTGVKNYSIDAYGELEVRDRQKLRAACYTMHGIFIGLWLPAAAKKMVRSGYLYVGKNGTDWEAGSWGGFLGYAKSYDPDGFEILAWGGKFWASNDFIEKYSDEAWATAEDLDDWRTVQALDVEGLRAKLAG